MIKENERPAQVDAIFKKLFIYFFPLFRYSVFTVVFLHQ